MPNLPQAANALGSVTTGNTITATHMNDLRRYVENLSAGHDLLYVGTGMPYTTVESALAVASSGQTIVVFPGTYDEINLTVPNGVSIMGFGANTSKMVTSQSTSPVFNLGGNNIIDGLSIINDNTGSSRAFQTGTLTAGTTIIRNCTTRANFDDYTLAGTHTFIVENCFFDGFGYDGFNTTVSTLIIRNCIAIASPDGAGDVALVNCNGGSVFLQNNYIALSTTTSNCAAIRTVASSGLSFVSQGNVFVNSTSGSGSAYVFQTSSFGVSNRFFSFGDYFSLSSGSGNATPVGNNGFANTFVLVGGNGSTATNLGGGTLMTNALSSTGTSLSFFGATAVGQQTAGTPSAAELESGLSNLGLFT